MKKITISVPDDKVAEVEAYLQIIYSVIEYFYLERR